jgi:hypothetical protein
MMDVESTLGSADEVRPFSVGIVPAGGVSSPLLLQNQHDAFLVFDALVEGTDIKCACSMVRLQDCLVTRFGYPNERELQTLMGAQLFPEGSGVYGIFEVRNSSWITEIEEQQQIGLPCAVTPSHRHILITFHNCTFEAIAQSVSAVALEGTRNSVVTRLSQLLV